MLISVVSICFLVHVLTNIQKKVAFHKIEKSVSTHLDVDKENSKQVAIATNRTIFGRELHLAVLAVMYRSTIISYTRKHKATQFI